MINQQQARPLPAIFIGKDMINARIERYLTQKHPVLSQQLSGDGPYRDDTKSIWYSREHVETWLDEMQHTNADGMRVYFGAYGDNEEGRPAGQLCLLVVLTRTGQYGNQEDIILEDEPDFTVRQESATPKSFSGNELWLKARPKEYNYGAPCPPVCNPAPPTSKNL